MPKVIAQQGEGEVEVGAEETGQCGNNLVSAHCLADEEVLNYFPDVHLLNNARVGGELSDSYQDDFIHHLKSPETQIEAQLLTVK